MAFTADKSEVVSLLIEAFLYGLYTFLFGCTVYVLIYKRSTPRVHYGMLMATVLMYLLAGTHLATNMVRVYKAFDVQTHMFTVFRNLRSFENIFRSSVILTEVVLGDVLLLYRCYVAWGGKLTVLILPLLMVTSTAATAAGVIYTFSQAPQNSTPFSLPPTSERFVIATQVLVIANNIFCTLLLSLKLWHLSRSMVSRSQRRALRAVAKIIAQSGLITTTTWIIWLVLTLLKHFSYLIVLNALAPMTGASFCLIISRVALGMCSESAKKQQQTEYEPSQAQSMGQYSNLENGLILGPILPVLVGTGRQRQDPMEFTMTSRHSERMGSQHNYGMEMPHVDNMALIHL